LQIYNNNHKILLEQAVGIIRSRAVPLSLLACRAGAAELRQAVQSGLLGKFPAIVSRENFSRFTHDFKKLYFYLKYLTP